MIPPLPKPLTLQVIRDRFYAAVLCDALDATGYRQQSPNLPIRALTLAQPMAGRCKTTLWVECDEEDQRPYELELRAVDSIQPGDVMVCAAAGSQRSGLWGELLTTAAQARGAAGVVVDGAVRDLDRMRAFGFPVWARGTSPYDSRNRNRVVDIDVDVEIGDVRCSPGDLLFADSDGIVVIPQRIEHDVLTRAWEKIHAENHVRQHIAQGMSASEAFARFGVL